jgi:hypothetical protein
VTTNGKTDERSTFNAWVRKQNRKAPELMGATEFSKLLGVSPTNLRKVSYLPEPIVVLTRGAVWRADVCQAFAQERRERLGLEDPNEAIPA